MRQHSVVRVPPARRDVWQAKQAQERPYLPLAVRIAFGVLLLALTYYLFPGTEDGTFFREIVVAALGAVITVFAAAAVAIGPLRRLWRERRESSARIAFDAATWRRSSIQVGRMKIPDIVVVASADHGREWTDGVDLRFTDLAPPRGDAPEMASLREHRLPQVRARALERGQTFVNDPCVDLVGASVRLEPDGQGRRRPVYELTPAPATYFDFSITTAALDASLPPATGLAGSLREHWRHRPTAIEHVANLPAMAKVGVSTVVVTSDHHLVLGVRGKTFIAGSDGSSGHSAVHVVAEGMVPTDLDRRGLISPAETARRGLREELNIGDADRAYGRVESLRAVGFFFDQLRWQPCFIYLARIDLTWDELQTLAPTASSYWEVERLTSVPFTIESPDVRALLLGEHPGLELASNHASAALWFALLHEHGLFKMRHELTLGSVPRVESSTVTEHRPADRQPV